MRAPHAAVDGEVNDPDMTGQLDIVGGGILTAYSPDEAGPAKTSLLFEGKSFRIPAASLSRQGMMISRRPRRTARRVAAATASAERPPTSWRRKTAGRFLLSR